MLKKLREQMKWIMMLIVVAFLLSTFLMYEGRNARRSPTRNADGTMSDYEVAQINGRALMRSELERGLRNVLENLGQRNVASLDMPAVYQAVLDQYVLESQMAREVEQRGIKVTDAEADQAMKAYADQYYPTREAFYQALQMSGVKLDDYRRDVARQMAAQRLYRDAVGDVTVSEDAAVQFYDSMKNLFYSSPEGYRVQVASFSTREAAEALHDRLAAGEGWDEAAAAVSADYAPSVDSITTEPAFLPLAAFQGGMFTPLASSDVGKVSPVFSLISGDFSVGMRTEHVDESVRPYDDVSADIRLMLREQETQRRTAAFQQELLEKAQLVVYDTSLFPQPNAEPNDAEPVNPEPAAEPVRESVSESAPEPVKESEPEPVKPEPESTPEPEPTPAPVERPRAEPVSEPEPASEPETDN